MFSICHGISEDGADDLERELSFFCSFSEYFEEVDFEAFPFDFCFGDIVFFEDVGEHFCCVLCFSAETFLLVGEKFFGEFETF